MKQQPQPSLKPIPTFDTEAQERAYWESHDSSDHFNWRRAVKTTPLTLPEKGSQEQDKKVGSTAPK